MAAGPEYLDVEHPLIEQLEGLGWTYIEGSLDDPGVTHRESFAQVIMEPVLRKRLETINLRDGKPWLDESRIQQAVSAVTRIASAKLMEANQTATELLLKGIAVEGLPDWDGGRGQTIHFIDWTIPTNNTFTVVNQFKVKCPPGHDTAKQHIIPDLVLFVNGIPLTVIECKARTVPEALPEAVNQLRRYHDQRAQDFEVEQHEGAPALFHTNQFLVATNFDDARVGTIGAAFDHYRNWKTLAPKKEAEVVAALGVASLSSQQRLVAGMLDPQNLLDVVRHYSLFMTVGGQTIKVVCHYQQFRAVTNAIHRLKSGKTREQNGEHDRRGGIIWHTQGSGKSLTMVFLVRKLRTDSELRRFKAVVITDRKDLQAQLSDTADLTGETVRVATNTDRLKTLIARPGPGLVFGTIQKYRETDPSSPAYTAEIQDSSPVYGRPRPRPPRYSQPFDVLNESSDILILIDEAHRSQAGDLHANLIRALPNAARIGFTGTPIIMGEKKRTHEIFGDYIDRYTLREAEDDGAIVPILYEGRTAKGAVKDGANLDELFEDLFRQRSAEELELIKKKYATKGQIFEAPRLIEEKARDMLRHYVTHILPNGFKAQVVAYSRRAAIRYNEALNAAREALLADADALSPEDKGLDDDALILRPPKVQAAVQAWRYRNVLTEIGFAVVISGGNNDDPAWSTWTDRAAVDQHIKRFKQPLWHDDPAKRDPLAFLIVKSMLLTGFDAPIEAVMYLDRPIREAELLQAVARVNRTGFGKRRGLVVDYFGVAHHLQEALAAYSDEDVEGALRSFKDEIPLLRDRHLRVLEVFRSRGVDDLGDVEEALAVLAEERVRAEFVVKLKEFNRCLDEVLPRPEGLEFVNDAKQLAYIHALARSRFKDTPELGKDVGAKVRKLIDDYVISLGIDPKIPPIELSDDGFEEHVGRQVGDRAMASEMEHAIRSHVRKHMDEDPVKYARLSERLEAMLQQLDGQWAVLQEALKGLIEQLKDDRTIDGETLPEMPAHCLPFLRLLTVEALGEDANPDEATRVKLMDATAEIVEIILDEAKIPGFWKPARMADQERLQGRLFEELHNTRLMTLAKAEATAAKLLELARANHERLMRS